MIEVQSIDLIIIDSDDKPVDKEGMKGGLVVEDEQEDSSKTDSWNIDEILSKRSRARLTHGISMRFWMNQKKSQARLSR